MHIASMTGFARANDELQLNGVKYSWYFEVKSVNGKSLDMKFRLPVFLDSLSLELKEIAGKYLSRGSVSVYLDWSSEKGEREASFNSKLLEQLADKAVEMQDIYGDKLAKPTIGELLAVSGVIEYKDSRLSDDELAELRSALKNSFEKACRNLQKAREAEGVKIRGALQDILNKIGSVVGRIEDISAGLPEKLKTGLEEKITLLLNGDSRVPEERLAQEVVLYVTRADIQEEIDRLKAHLKTAAELLNLNEPAGRRLDFLCQELNREANTTCSKSSDIELTNLGMELKALIEQLREQVQNME